jgi:hypothetical protein
MENDNKKKEQCTIQNVSFSLLEKLTGSALSGIMANPNCMPRTIEDFSNIAEGAIRVAKETIRQLNES